MKHTIFSYATLALVVAGCSSNDENIVVDLTDTPIKVNASVAELATRAGYDNDNLPGMFYLTVTHPTKTAYTYTNACIKSTGSNSWESYTTDGSSKLTMLWADNTTAVKASAATFQMTGDTDDLNVQIRQNTEENVQASDHLLWETTSVTPSANGIEVALKHIMSKINIKITLGNEHNATTNPITNVAVGGSKVSGTFTYSTEAWAASGDASEVVSLAGDYTPIQDNVTNAEANYEVILVPQTIEANGFYVSFQIGEKSYKWVSPDAVTLLKGTQYTLELTAGKNKVEQIAFTSSAWTSNGQAEQLETE